MLNYVREQVGQFQRGGLERISMIEAKVGLTERIQPPREWNPEVARALAELRDPWFRVVSELLDCVYVSSIDFFRGRGFRWIPASPTTSAISSPIAPSSDSAPVELHMVKHLESQNKSELVPLAMAQNESAPAPLYLADSAQFLLELGCRWTERGCFYVMHSFRNEKPDLRHLSQFVHAEAELRGSLEDVMVCVEDHIRYLAAALLGNARPELMRVVEDLSHLERVASGETQLQSISFDECDDLLEGRSDCITLLGNGARTLTPKGEAALLRVRNAEFLWVRNWDSLAVPFYQAGAIEEGLANNADLLFGLGEVVGAGERHATAQALDASLVAHEIDSTPYSWYREMKQEYPLQTAGYGMGVERFLAWATKVLDVRKFQLFPRDQEQNGSP